MQSAPTTPPEIRILPPLVVNQIAAGEVVERPASVVKELMENALDAGGTHITCEIEAGGIELIRITDNGRGIPPEQLPLAIHPHATSKVRAAEDLDAIATMGFRGEALASIASVSRLSIRSRTAETPEAFRIECAGDEQSDVRPDAGPAGTCVTVRNLFFNTPARRKFLRTPNTEQGHCTDIVRNIAMANPGIAFTMRIDGRTTLEVPANQSPRDRIVAVIGAAASSYLVVEGDRFDNHSVSLWGLAGLPDGARPTTKAQHVFLNGRPVRDKTITHALREAYRGVIEPGRHPAAVLLIDMPPDTIDVNVHPAKSEVRFRDQGIVHKTVYSAVRGALLQSDLTPASSESDALRFEAVRSATSPEQAAASTRQRFTEYFEKYVGQTDQKSFDYDGLKAAVEAEREDIARERAALEQSRADLASDHMRSSRTPDIAGQTAMPEAAPAQRYLQVHGSFIVTQDEQGVVIIDQHALHERVMFEKLKQRIIGADLESQRLLTPAILETSPQRVDTVEKMATTLTRLGIQAEPMGPTAVGIHAFPTFLFDKGVEPAPFLDELLEMSESRPSPVGDEEALHEILDMMACKAAVKAGDSLAPKEIEELLALRDSVERSSNCPHGRPTAIRLTIRELEKEFGRR